jgi:hypothetical protein
MKFPAVSSEAVQVGVERAFAIIERHHNPPEWRYRLGVRTEDSQLLSRPPKALAAYIFVCFTFVGFGRLLLDRVKFGYTN